MGLTLLSFANWTSGLQKSNMVMNMALVQIYDSDAPILNLAQINHPTMTVSGTRITDVPSMYSGGYLDYVTGQLIPGAAITNVNNIQYAVFEIPPGYNSYNLAFGPAGSANNDPWWHGQVFHISWSGTSNTLSIPGFSSLGTGGTLTKTGSNTGTITCGSTDARNLVINFSVDDINNPPQNVKIWKAEFDTNVANGEFWNPKFIANTSNWGVIRLLDWQNTLVSGVVDISQMAGAEYCSPFHNFGNAGIAFTGTVAAGVLTVTSSASSSFAIGSTLQGDQVPAGVKITSLGTGTGGNGTYNLNNSSFTISTPQPFTAFPTPGDATALASNGPKGSIHPSLMCDLANKCNVHIWHPLPFAITDQCMIDVCAYYRDHLKPGLQVWFEYGNELWNFEANAMRYPGMQLNPFGYNQYGQWGGYRSAQLMMLAKQTFGNRNKWQGILAGQCASAAVIDGAMTGVTYALANSNPNGYVLTDLYDAFAVAPYWGPFETANAKTISSITPGATTSISATSHGYTSGQSKRIFVSADGTVSLNNKDFVVTVVDANTYTIPVNTTGSSYSGTMFGANSELFMVMDQSLTLHNSTPASYPTKYTYFIQQYCKALLTGSSDVQASGSAYTMSSGASLVMVANGTAPSGSGIQDGIQQNALRANGRKLKLYQYEGGPNLIPSGSVGSNSQLVEYSINYMFDGPNPDPTYNIGQCYKRQFDLTRAVGAPYPAKYVDGVPGGVDAWMGLRYFGDEGNPTWQALLLEAANPPYVDPAPPATWSLTYNSSTDKSFNGGTTTAGTCSLTSPGGLAVILTGNTNGPAINSVVLTGPGGPYTATVADAVSVGGAWPQAIYSVVVPAGTYTVTVNWAASAGSVRSIVAMTLSGLITNAVKSSMWGGSQKQGNLVIEKGSFVVGCSSLTGAATFDTQGSLAGSGVYNIFDFNATQNFGFFYINPGVSFTNPAFVVRTNSTNGITAASYK